MAILKNGRHERFCQEYVFGPAAGNASAAFRAVGYADHATAAARLRRRPDVTRRIAELVKARDDMEAKALTQATEKLALTKERVLQELARVAFANLLDYIKPDGKGGVIVMVDQLSSDLGSAISQLSVLRSARDPKLASVRIKLNDKLSALEKLGRHLGLFAQHGGNPDAVQNKKTQEELRAEVIGLFKRVAGNDADLKAALRIGADGPKP